MTSQLLHKRCRDVALMSVDCALQKCLAKERRSAGSFVNATDGSDLGAPQAESDVNNECEQTGGPLERGARTYVYVRVCILAAVGKQKAPILW